MFLPRFAVSFGAAATAVALAFGLTTHLSASAGQTTDNTDLKKRLAALEEEQKAILKELQEIKALLQSRPAPTPIPPGTNAPTSPLQAGPPAFDLTIAGSPSTGRQNAKLVVVEFSDFQCPFCGRYSREELQPLQREYVDTGKVLYVFRNFPLERLHPLALRAAEAADCAHAQGKFWDMHERLFANQQALSEPDLVKTGEAVGLNMAAFQQCLASQSVSPTRIRQDQTEGARAGISGTPTFFVGTLTKEGKVHVLRRLVGARPLASFKTVLDELLSSGPS